MALARNLMIATFAAALSLAPAAHAAKTDASQFSIEQIAAIDQVSAYLNTITTLTGDFVQTAPDGGVTQGRFFIEKPGRLRFEYAPPAQLQIVSDGLWVAVQDKKLKTTEKYPLVTTPLRMILSDNVDLMRDAKILAVFPETDLVTLSIEETTGEAPGTLTLMFDTAENKLTRWTVTDVQGLDTSVSLENTVAGEPIDPSKFRIIEHRILDVGGSNAR
ncbi:LolA family protein [Microbaculum marinisediminis]|uniref:Outer membrane lipoprotein carrier protein LolA n=1 Tax=Microbaculum marinisediminis TaxID=2931392 RepID=A0AAW5QYM2_9HYPH|nr:outer membrane lipoprotein carrier protein LolA [Microbaculum sp. A6E488]MCT8972232.1 outer membrane lipoprotein carrier protein LolA [Microbaculum sp. A6E488]